MNRKEIIERLLVPGTMPTLEEVDFIIEENKKETEDLSKEILARAEECRKLGEESSGIPGAEKYFDFEKDYIAMEKDLWERHYAAEKEWIKVREDLQGTLEQSTTQEEYYTYILGLFDENRMTKH